LKSTKRTLGQKPVMCEWLQGEGSVLDTLGGLPFGAARESLGCSFTKATFGGLEEKSEAALAKGPLRVALQSSG
jgi:hypothetical protein